MFAFLPQNIVQLDKLLYRLVCAGLLSNIGTLWLELDVLPDQSVTNIQISSDIYIIGSKNIHFFDVEWVMEVLAFYLVVNFRLKAPYIRPQIYLQHRRH